MTKPAHASAAEVRTVVHLVRHGEVHNPDRILYGRLPEFHLSDLGHEMAELVASALADHDITHVISSPLERARETAAPIAAAHDLEVELDDQALEAVNAFEGRAVAGGKGIFRDPRLWALMVNPMRPSWGEPYADLAARMQASVDAARDLARGHEAVIVSHQAPIWMLRLAIEGRRFVHDPRRRECTLASLTSLTYRGDELESLAYSEPAAALLPLAHSGAGA
ncbi:MULTISPECIES: histidine phosphatase family protein [unclassified Knoellia]|uniref:histidine phosphatase family protein n=1 Tax=Knoellia altitudinis TaxID=3404795 RepID=UPI003610E9DE